MQCPSRASLAMAAVLISETEQITKLFTWQTKFTSSASLSQGKSHINAIKEESKIGKLANKNGNYRKNCERKTEKLKIMINSNLNAYL